MEPKKKLSDIDGWGENVLEYLQMEKGVYLIPIYLYSHNSDGTWDCAFCDNVNESEAMACSKCLSPLQQQELFSDNAVSNHIAYIDQKSKESKNLSSNLAKDYQTSEELLKEEIQVELADILNNLSIKRKHNIKKAMLVIFITTVLLATFFFVWKVFLEKPQEYKEAMRQESNGSLYEASMKYHHLGEYKDAQERALNTYVSAFNPMYNDSEMLNRYKWLLDNGYSTENILSSISSMKSEEERIAWFAWLAELPDMALKDLLFEFTIKLNQTGHYVDSYWIYDKLDGYKDSEQQKAILLAENKVHVITYYFGDNFDPVTKIVLHGATIPKINIAERENHIFVDWFLDSDGKDRLSSTKIVTTSLELFGIWENRWKWGGLGPAGGYIFYDKGEFSDGWRYLEAAPDGWYSNHQNDPRTALWYYQRGDKKYIVGTEKAVGSGKANTEALVNVMGDKTVRNYDSTEQIKNAAKLAYDFSMRRNSILYNDWFLPSNDELVHMYTLHAEGLGGFSDDGYYLSSSENDEDTLWAILFGEGNEYSYAIGRNSSARVRPIRAF